MAGLLGQAIIAMCLGTSGQYNAACTHAIDAGTRQVGIRQEADNLEEKSVNLAKTKSTETFGPAPVVVVTSGVFVYKVIKDKSLQFKLPNVGIADTISNKITDKSYTLNFTWKW